MQENRKEQVANYKDLGTYDYKDRSRVWLWLGDLEKKEASARIWFVFYPRDHSFANAAKEINASSLEQSRWGPISACPTLTFSFHLAKMAIVLSGFARSQVAVRERSISRMLLHVVRSKGRQRTCQSFRIQMISSGYGNPLPRKSTSPQ